MKYKIGGRTIGPATIASRIPAAMQVRWHRGIGSEPALGAHSVTPRGVYSHHGIYVGKGKLVHYAVHARSLHRGLVEDVTIACPAARRKVWISRAIVRVTLTGKS